MTDRDWLWSDYERDEGEPYTAEELAWLAMVEEQDELFARGAYDDDWRLCDA